MIRILEKRKGLQTGGLYFIKTDTGKPILVHHKTNKSVGVSYELLRKIKHEYVPDYQLGHVMEIKKPL